VRGTPADARGFDVIVVGARCAGSPLATLLARAGLRVCLLDRARFPSDTPSTHGVQPSGVRILERLGVLERLLEVATPIERGTIALDEARIEVDAISERLGAPMLNVRRIVLDAVLLEAAGAAGADVRTCTAVTGLLEEDGRVVGVATSAGGLRARLVVGADGARSTVAGLVGATEYHRTPPGRIFAWAYFDGADAPDDKVWLGSIGDHAFLASPTDAGLFMAAVTFAQDRRDELRGDRAAAHGAALTGWPDLDACLATAARVGPVRMMSRWHGYFRRSAGAGWVLVGDAGHFKDPTPGQGISDALRQTAALAPAIVDALGGTRRPDDVLHDWWRWRDRDAREMYWFAHDMGSPGRTPPLRAELRRRVAADPEFAYGLLRVLNHELAPSALFTPSLALAVTAQALRTGREDRGAVLREAVSLVATDVLRRARRPPRRRR
jgi:2-polyprenyl-6-methoxyphenol hydroxylase-like FAD-dependent oxidoreductase